MEGKHVVYQVVGGETQVVGSFETLQEANEFADLQRSIGSGDLVKPLDMWVGFFVHKNHGVAENE